MKIYNSYTDQLEEFVPKHSGKVEIYVCGPTVYNFIHIGNARPVVFFDTVRRYFEAKGYDVIFASNFTDVDDKIIQKAVEEKISESEVSEFYIDAFLNDIISLNCKTDYIKPKVTEYMQYIIDYIQALIDKGYAYQVEGDVYFRVKKLKDYGALSNRDVDDLISGSRVNINELKESPLDFTLWKKTKEGLNFDSQFSQGRPGWHTECVAMIDDIFGEEIDIHGGGIDLKFPHHENEIAQAKVMHNHRVANYWMHNGRLSMKNVKMSKSIGNVILVKDFKYKMPLRYFLLSTHYRAPLNYSEESFSMYVKEFEKLENTYKSVFFKLDIEDFIDEDKEIDNQEILSLINNFNDSMDNDFNTANAITALQGVIKLTNQNIRKPNNLNMLNQSHIALKYMINILGLRISVSKIKVEDRVMYKDWQNARTSKDFESADRLRKLLVEKGVLWFNTMD